MIQSREVFSTRVPIEHMIQYRNLEFRFSPHFLPYCIYVMTSRNCCRKPEFDIKIHSSLLSQACECIERHRLSIRPPKKTLRSGRSYTLLQSSCYYVVRMTLLLVKYL